MEDNGFLDLSDHDSFANGVPHKTFERIRNEDPVFWTKEKNGRGFWSITKPQRLQVWLAVQPSNQ